MRGSRFVAGLLALATSSLTLGSVIHFDPDGAGPDAAVNAASLDWLPGDAMVLANPANSATGTVYYQAKLGSVLDANGHVLPTPGLNAPGGYQITAVFGIDVNVGFSGQTLVFSQIGGTPATSYFSMYFDSTQDADNLAGTGFRLGPTATKIYGASINNALSVVASLGNTLPLDTANPANYAGDTTKDLTGGGNVSGPTTSDNSAFFLDGSNVASMLTNGTLIVPFSDVDPSMQFRIGPDGSTTILPFTITSENGDSGQIALESDAASSFTLVPEPALLTLLPLAAFAMRRRKAR